MPRAWWRAPRMVAFCVWRFLGTMVRHPSSTSQAAWLHMPSPLEMSQCEELVFWPPRWQEVVSHLLVIFIWGEQTLNPTCNSNWFSREMMSDTFPPFRNDSHVKMLCFNFLPPPPPAFEYQIELILRFLRAVALHSFHSAIPYHITSPHQHSYLPLMASSFHSIHSSQGSYLWST